MHFVSARLSPPPPPARPYSYQLHVDASAALAHGVKLEQHLDRFVWLGQLRARRRHRRRRRRPALYAHAVVVVVSENVTGARTGHARNRAPDLHRGYNVARALARTPQVRQLLRAATIARDSAVTA